MSNLAKGFIRIPHNIEVKKTSDALQLRGKFGRKSLPLFNQVRLSQRKIYLNPEAASRRKGSGGRVGKNVLRGTTSALLRQALVGLVVGYREKLQLVGVGYRVTLERPGVLDFKLGFSHQISLSIPQGLHVSSRKPTLLTIFGADRQQVADFAATIRSYRPPEPYKGKGVLYFGEVISLKEGKRSL